jgi:hypothetical protein
MRWAVWLLPWLLQTAPANAQSLSTVLQTLGEADRVKHASAGCRYTEVATFEELNGDKTPTAREIRTFLVTHKAETQTRKMVALKTELGRLSDIMRDRTTKAGEQKSPKGPFHPDIQPQYRFALIQASSPERLRISITPVQKHKDRILGYAEVDKATGNLVSLDFAPSEFPALLSEFHMHLEFTQTDCGTMTRRLELMGEGGFLFFRKRFRVASSFQGFEPLGGAARPDAGPARPEPSSMSVGADAGSGDAGP